MRSKASVNISRLLKDQQTEAESALWFHLRSRRLSGWKFYRQYRIGRYFVDFCCRQGHLIVELDGFQHSLRKEDDAFRTRYLEAAGFHVIRFWNGQVLKQMPMVLESILKSLP